MGMPERSLRASEIAGARKRNGAAVDEARKSLDLLATNPVRAFSFKYIDEALATVLELCQSAEKEDVRLKAAVVMLEYCAGKPQFQPANPVAGLSGVQLNTQVVIEKQTGPDDLPPKQFPDRPKPDASLLEEFVVEGEAVRLPKPKTLDKRMERELEKQLAEAEAAAAEAK